MQRQTGSSHVFILCLHSKEMITGWNFVWSKNKMHTIERDKIKTNFAKCYTQVFFKNILCLSLILWSEKKI